VEKGATQMCTESIIPAPEALVSPQLAAAVLEIEAEPETAEATTKLPASPEGGAAIEEQDSHLVMIQVTLGRIRQLYPAMKKSDEERSKLRLAVGYELWVLQDLHAKPGYGDFVARLNSLGNELGFGRSTGYALITEYEISAGLRAKKEKKDPGSKSNSGVSIRLSNARKDEGQASGKSFTISADPTRGLELSAPAPSTPLDIDLTESKKKVELQIPESQLAAWDEAILLLQRRVGFEAATQSELVIEAVLTWADLVRIQGEQSKEKAEEEQHSEAHTTKAYVEGVCEQFM
jgi:hypothetical protein